MLCSYLYRLSVYIQRLEGGVGMWSYFELSLLFLVFDAAVGIHPSLFLGTGVKVLLSPRAKLNLLASRLYLSRLGLCPISTRSSLFMSWRYLNLLGYVWREQFRAVEISTQRRWDRGGKDRVSSTVNSSPPRTLLFSLFPHLPSCVVG